MTIGKLAAAAGVPAATVRYYEQRGLLAPARRSRAGYRMYDAEDLQRLRFIRHAQSVGFALEDVRALLALHTADPASCERVANATSDKLHQLRALIEEMQRMERALAAQLRSCATRRPADSCPVLVAYSGESETSIQFQLES